MKRPNLRITGAEEEDQLKGTDNILNKIIEENLLNLKKEMPVRIQEVYRTPNRLNPKKKNIQGRVTCQEWKALSDSVLEKTRKFKNMTMASSWFLMILTNFITILPGIPFDINWLVLLSILKQHQRHCLSKTAYQAPPYPCSENVLWTHRHFAAAATRPARKIKKEGKDKEKISDGKTDDIERIKSYVYMESEPEDDVYLKRLYPRRIYEVEKAVALLKKFQVLDFTNPKQGVYLDLTLDMALGKKKNVEPFASVISLPYPFTSEVNKVAVFTENASEIKIAEENGAVFAGGVDLVKKILDDEVVVDFYVAVPEIMTELNPLRKKLKKRFPKSTRNSIGRDIPKMLELFKTGHEIMVNEERPNFLSTKIATKENAEQREYLCLGFALSKKLLCKHIKGPLPEILNNRSLTGNTQPAVFLWRLCLFCSNKFGIFGDFT
ncbi:hypothetical protein STEG23_036146, partial [Scotinomys teguina]